MQLTPLQEIHECKILLIFLPDWNLSRVGPIFDEVVPTLTLRMEVSESYCIFSPVVILRWLDVSDSDSVCEIIFVVKGQLCCRECHHACHKNHKSGTCIGEGKGHMVLNT